MAQKKNTICVKCALRKHQRYGYSFMSTEKSITATITRHLTRQKLFWIKIHGSPMQKKGLPDLLVIKDGKPYFMEVKTPWGKPTPMQEYRIEQIRDAGAACEIVCNWDDVKRVLNL